MIDRQEMMELLLTACPSFTARWNEGIADDWLDEHGNLLHYLVLGALAAHLVALVRAGTTDELPSTFAVAERLHVEGDPYVKEAATIGLLEGIQNHAGHAGLDQEEFVKWLGPVSKEFWDRLNGFWSGERPYVRLGFLRREPPAAATCLCGRKAFDRLRAGRNGRSTHDT